MDVNIAMEYRIMNEKFIIYNYPTTIFILVLRRSYLIFICE
jgi:hypothetical protein